MKKTKIARIVLLILTCSLLLTVMFGCAGSTETPNYSWTAADVDPATYFSRILPLNAEARQMFTAAANGYNMKAQGFDDSRVTGAADDPLKDPAAVNGVSIQGAKEALALVRPSDDSSILKYNEFCEALTPEIVKDIVGRMATTVELTVNNGPIDTILVWIGKFVQILTKITGKKYVFGLFLFAIVIELLMLPFGIKQQKNSIKQARLRPKEMAIRNKYKGRNDQATMQKMQQEIQQLYQNEGVNPMSGCLPLLIQLPVIMALYQIVIDPLRYVLGQAAGLSTALTAYCTTAKAAGGLGISIGAGKGTIELLSQAAGKLNRLQNFAYYTNAGDCYNVLTETTNIPDFNLFGINMGQIPGFHQPYILLLVPILTFVLYFASMKLNRKFTYQPATNDAQMGCSNNIMDITMPLMSVYITFIVPAAVGIYWMFKCVISTLKQFLVHKAMPLPTFTEEDYKAAERELKGKSKPEKKQAGERVTKSGVKVRSLHHIDDEDDELPPPQKETDDASDAKKETAPQAENVVPNLKEDRKNNTDKNK